MSLCHDCNGCDCFDKNHNHCHKNNSPLMLSIGIMLVPSDSSLVVSPNTMQTVGNILSSMGASSGMMQKVANILSSMGPLSPTRVINAEGNDDQGIWLMVVPGSFQPEFLSVPWFNGLGNREF